MDFTGYSTWVPTGRPNLFPIITFGKYVEEEGRRKLSAALTISHASADGYHASMFFERLQEVLDEIVIEKNNKISKTGIINTKALSYRWCLFVFNGVERCGYKIISLAKIQPK